MKKYLSVFMLFARSSIFKVMLLIVVMAVIEAGVFYLRTLDVYLGLEAAFENSFTKWIFAAAFIGITVILCSTGSEFGSKTGYTINRLSIKETSVFYWQWIYNTLVYFILWAAQIAVSLALCEIYKAMVDPLRITEQTVFLAYYRSDFLHSLLPLGDSVRWIRNIFMLLGLGAASAFFPYQNRRGKLGMEIIVMSALSMIFFSEGLGGYTNEVLMCFVSAFVIISVRWKMWIRWNEDET